MVPKNIKKFLVNCWLFSEEEVEKVGLADHYIVWFCGIDHIADREKTPDKLEILTEFKKYRLQTSFDKKIQINFKEDIDFSYYILKRFIETYYKGDLFEMRVIRIPEGFYYLEFKLDERYSFLYQQIWHLTDEDLKDIGDVPLREMLEEPPVKIPFDRVFLSMDMTSDMVL